MKFKDNNFVGKKSFSLITPMAFGLCSSPLGVDSFVFECLFFSVIVVLIVYPLGRFLSNEDSTVLFVKKKKKKRYRPGSSSSFVATLLPDMG
jgi:hypothetical protein